MNASDSCPFPFTNLTGGTHPCDITLAAWWGQSYLNFQMLLVSAWSLLVIASVYRIYAAADSPSFQRWTGRLTLASSVFGACYAIDPDGFAARVPSVISITLKDLSTVSLESFAILFVFSFRFCAGLLHAVPVSTSLLRSPSRPWVGVCLFVPQQTCARIHASPVCARARAYVDSVWPPS
jgi:hypothetical protein